MTTQLRSNLKGGHYPKKQCPICPWNKGSNAWERHMHVAHGWEYPDSTKGHVKPKLLEKYQVDGDYRL